LGLRKKLGPSAGIDPKDDKAVRQFDRKRPGKSSVTSNLKIGRYRCQDQPPERPDRSDL